MIEKVKVKEVTIPLSQSKLRWLRITSTYLFIYHGDGRPKDKIAIDKRVIKKWVKEKKVLGLYPIWAENLKALKKMI